MTFSIVIPTFNEERDIRDTLNALLRLDYGDKEILVVDDSKDATPDIVTRYRNKGVRLIHPGGGGRCEARNIGILESKGDIICVLNADVRPRPDFLKRLAKHYQDGADYVLVRSSVSNRETVFARYLASVESEYFKHPEQLGWTEGFSCRRNLALESGLFPTGFALPICAGEDGDFALRLARAGGRKVLDFSIIVDHAAPASLKEFWNNRVGRGMGSAQVHRFIDGWSIPMLLVWNTTKALLSISLTVTLVRPLLEGLSASRSSNRHYKDMFGLTIAWIIERAAFHTGELRGVIRLLQVDARS
jgi:glycosyltransferase involved in cell wall biosynthesis